jgi:hypothetical protein
MHRAGPSDPGGFAPRQDYTVWVKIRPHCLEFLEHLADKFELIVRCPPARACAHARARTYTSTGPRGA